MKSKVNTTPIIKVISNNPKNLWSTIVMYLGVDQRMERVLGITIYPIAVNDSNIFKGIVGISKSSNAHSGPSISDFSSAFIQNLCQECHLRQLTATTAPQNSDNLSLNESSEYKLDRNGIMEPSYIRDLQLAFGIHNNNILIMKTVSVQRYYISHVYLFLHRSAADGSSAVA